MRIAFLCSSLAPGADGVGDYTRRLAEALELLGHNCLCIALNDSKLQMESLGESSVDGVQESPKLVRLSHRAPWASRLNVAGCSLRGFQPDWISLQYVPWGFERRGLHLGLAARLAAVIRSTKLHIMCHELWIDKSFPMPLKLRLLGQIQKPVVSNLLRALSPEIVHTQTEFYRRMLSRIGITSELLPLHGNIPVTASAPEGRDWLSQILNDNLDEDFHAGFFGDLLPTLDLDELTAFVVNIEGAGKKLHLLSGGRLTATGGQIWELIKQKLGPARSCHALGGMESDDISKYLAGLDLGLTTYPHELAGKSGAIAAMLEHGKSVRILGRFGSSDKADRASMFLSSARCNIVAQTATTMIKAFSDH